MNTKLNFNNLGRQQTDLEHLIVSNNLYKLDIKEQTINTLKDILDKEKDSNIRADFVVDKIIDEFGNICFIAASLNEHDVILSTYSRIDDKSNIINKYISGINHNVVFDFKPTEQQTFLVDRLYLDGINFSNISHFIYEIPIKNFDKICQYPLNYSYILEIFKGLDITFNELKLPENIYSSMDYLGKVTKSGLVHYVHKILQVNQLTPTTRFALIAEPSSYINKTWDDIPKKDYQLYLSIFSSDTPGYDYIDEGRLLYKKQNMHSISAFFIDITEKEFPISSAAIDNYTKKRQEIPVINSIRLKAINEKFNNYTILKKQQTDLPKVINKKLMDKYDNATDEKPMMLNGVAYYKDKIEYQKQILSFDKINIKYILSNLIRKFSPDIVDFDLVTSEFIRTIVETYSYTKNLQGSGTLGTIPVTLEFKGKLGNLSYINNYKIKYADLIEVLKRALCYNTEKEYSNYLEHVSKCSLHIYDRLVNGLRLNLKDDLLGLTNLNLTIPIYRNKHRNFIKLGDRDLKISDINGLISLEDCRSMHGVIKKLTTKNIIKDLVVEDIGYVIDLGIEYQKSVEKKNAELKSKMEELLNIKENKVSFSNGDIRTGYLIAGTWKTYFVSSDTAEAFAYPDGARICMITKHDTTTNTDNVIMRVFERAMVLKNDSKVANRVETLKVFNKLEREVANG